MAINCDKPLFDSFKWSEPGAKLRLFAALAVLMLVTSLIERSLDPAFRQWILGGDFDQANASSIDTRLPPRPPAGEPDSFVAEQLPPPTGWDDALSRVEDDTLFLRPAEREAWRLIEKRVRDTDPAELRRQSLGEIGFTQLFQQPEAYRGRVVTIRGRVMYASQVGQPSRLSREAATETDRFVLWIMPAGGPTLPIVVYAQSLPPGFPAIERQAGGRLTKLREDVTIHGILLKRGSYHATDGPRTAPVILANMPEWTLPVAAASDWPRGGLGPRWLWPTIGAAIVLAIVFVAAAFWFARPAKGQGRGAASDRLVAADFRGVSLGPTTTEMLRHMEQERE